MEKRYVSYYRVSTTKQGANGYGIDAQKAAVLQFVERNLKGCEQGSCIAKEFVEVQSGRNNERPILQQALIYCKKHKCVLIVAKLDRLSRDVEFLFKIQNSGVQFRCTDLPELDTLTLGVFASFAQFESERIRKRTKEALAARKARGLKKKIVNNLSKERIKAGHEAIKKNARTAKPVLQVKYVIKNMRKGGSTYREIADYLNGESDVKGTGIVFETRRKGEKWHPIQVQRIDKRFAD